MPRHHQNNIGCLLLTFALSWAAGLGQAILVAERVSAGEPDGNPKSLGDLSGPWQLFVDDSMVAEKSNLERTYHAFEKHGNNPLLVADQPWEGDIAYVYGTILPDEDASGYRMWYHSCTHEDKTNRHLYATSDDGLNWTKPNLGQVDDGVNWIRQEPGSGGRMPILPLGPSGSWDDAMVFTPNHPMVEGDTIKLYYGGFDETHGNLESNAAIGLATLRKDGFASLDAGQEVGCVTTKPLVNAAGPLRLNCDTDSGWVKAAVLDAAGNLIEGYGLEDCTAVRADGIDLTLTWGPRNHLPVVAGPLQIYFELQNASIYSFATEDSVLCGFESPTFTPGALNGQDGWIAGSGTFIDAMVVDRPAGLPTSCKAQSVTLGRWTDRSLAGAGFADVTKIGETLLYTAGGPYEGVELVLYGSSLTADGKFAWTRISDDSIIEYYDGEAWQALANVPGGTAWHVDMLLDFPTQQYTVIWTDLISLISYTSPLVDFLSPCTVAQAEAGCYLSNARSANAGTTLYLDNVSFVTGSSPSIPGDANHDKKVDAADAAILAANWRATGADWTMGDFNRDGIVDDTDATLMAANWHVGVPAAQSERIFSCSSCALGSRPTLKRRSSR